MLANYILKLEIGDWKPFISMMLQPMKTDATVYDPVF